MKLLIKVFDEDGNPKGEQFLEPISERGNGLSTKYTFQFDYFVLNDLNEIHEMKEKENTKDESV